MLAFIFITLNLGVAKRLGFEVPKVSTIPGNEIANDCSDSVWSYTSYYRSLQM